MNLWGGGGGGLKSSLSFAIRFCPTFQIRNTLWIEYASIYSHGVIFKLHHKETNSQNMICMQIDSNPNSKTENLFNSQKLNSEFFFLKKDLQN